jgi:hypothetical protein
MLMHTSGIKKSGGDGHRPHATLLVVIKNNFKNPGCQTRDKSLSKTRTILKCCRTNSFELISA